MFLSALPAADVLGQPPQWTARLGRQLGLSSVGLGFIVQSGLRVHSALWKESV